jgi:hypothetical protein
MEILETFSRLILAENSYCNPSTFCLYPAKASKGTGYLVNSVLYKWAGDMKESQSNVKLLPVPFLNMQPIVDKRMSAAQIIAWLREPEE